MQFQVLQPIVSPELIAESYATLHQVIQKPSRSITRLIKQENWIAACTTESWRSDSWDILSVLQKHGYDELIAVSWDFMEPVLMKIPVTEQGLEEFFRKNCFGWTILFAGEPDWVMLFAIPDDFWLVAGMPELVEEILGCSVEEGFDSIEEMIRESRHLADWGREQFSNIVHQLREVYPVAQTGDTIDLELGISKTLH